MTCELVKRRDAGTAPAWDAVFRTRNWDVVHAFGTAVEGWMVLVVRRHISAVASLRDDEAQELGRLIKEVSRGIQAIVSCPKTYVVQFAEHLQHAHVHVHVIPRAVDLPEEYRGPGIFHLLGVSSDRSVPEERMNQIAEALRLILRLTAA